MSRWSREGYCGQATTVYTWCATIVSIPEDLRFVECTTNSKLFIPGDQLGHVLNIDKTDLSINGGSENGGGHPKDTFFDSRMPQLGQGTNKVSSVTALPKGSTAAGGAISPKLQFSTKVKSS